eukprot:gene487-8001_t
MDPDSQQKNVRKGHLSIKIKDGTVVKIPALNVEPIVEERESNKEEFENNGSEYFKKFFSRIKDKIDSKRDEKNNKLAKFMSTLMNTSPPNKWFEAFAKIIQSLQFMALLVIPLLPLGYYSSWIMKIYTFIFLGGAYGNTLFHFSFFVGTFFTFLLLSLTYFASKTENESAFYFLGFFVKLSSLFYIPSIIGSLSIIFKLKDASWTILDLYIWFFGVFGIFQAILLFSITYFYTIFYYNWIPQLEGEWSLFSRPHSRFDLFSLIGTTIICVFYHFTSFSYLNYITVSVNMIIVFSLIIAFIYYNPYYSNHFNRIMITFLIEKFFVTVVMFITTIVNRYFLIEYTLPTWIGCIFFGVLFGVLVPSARSFVSWIIINSDVTKFFNPVDVELGARYLIHDDDIDYCDQVYKNLRNKFERSILFHLYWASHLFIVSKTPLKALLVLDSIAEKSMSLDLKLNFLLRRYLFRDNVERFPDPESHAVGVKKAKQFDIEARKLHLMFWYSLVNYSDSMFQKDMFIPQLVEKIVKVENEAKDAYSKIMEMQDSKVFKEYSKFAEEVLNEVDSAQQYYARALEIEALEYEKELETDRELEDDDEQYKFGDYEKEPAKALGDIELSSAEDLSGKYGANIDEEGNTNVVEQKNVKSPDENLTGELLSGGRYGQSEDEFSGSKISDQQIAEINDGANPDTDDSLENGYGLNIDEEGNYKSSNHSEEFLDPEDGNVSGRYGGNFSEEKSSGRNGHLTDEDDDNEPTKVHEELIEIIDESKDRNKISVPKINIEDTKNEKKSGKKINLRDFTNKRKSHFTPEAEFFDQMKEELPKKNIMIPKLNFGVEENFQENYNASLVKNLGQETFRSDLIIAKDDDISLNSGISDDDVLDERNTIGADERILERVLAEKINQFMTSKNSTYFCLFGTLTAFVLLIFLIVFLIAFIDIGLFSVQMLPLIASGKTLSLSQRIAFETAAAQDTASTNKYQTGLLSFNETMFRLKKDVTQYSHFTNQFDSSVNKLRRECSFTCYLAEELSNLWNSPTHLVKYYNQFNGNKVTELTSLREHEFNYIQSSRKLSLLSKNEFKNSIISPEYNYVLDNVDVQLNETNKIQTIFFHVNLGTTGLIGIFGLILLMSFLFTIIPFCCSYYEMKLKRFKSLILYDELEFSKVLDQIYSNLKARDILTSDNHKQRSAKYFANLETTSSFLSKFKRGIFGNICYYFCISIIVIIFILISIFSIYGCYFYMYSFISSDLKCSGERYAITSRIQFLVQEIQRFPGNSTLYHSSLDSNLSNLLKVHRGILNGDSSIGCVASSGRYFKQDNLMNNERCGINSTTNLECMSVNSLVQWYRTTATQLRNTQSTTVFEEFKTAELQYLYPLLEHSQNLFLEEGVVYADIMFNALMFVFILSIVVLVSLYFGFVLPILEEIGNENETTKRMLSMVPLKTVFTHHPIRDYYNSEIFNQVPQAPEYKEEAQLYWNTLEYGLNPIIIFRKQNDQLLIIHVNKIARKLFGYDSSMKDRPLINLFPAQEQKISDMISIAKAIIDMGGSNESVALKAITKSGREFSINGTFTNSKVGRDTIYVMQLEEENSIKSEIMKEKDSTINSLLYNNIPQQYINLIQSGQPSIYNSLKSITVVAIEILNIDQLLTEGNDKEKSEILNCITNLFSKLVEEYDIQQIQSGFGVSLFALDIFDVHDKETRISNVLSFALQAVQDFKKINDAKKMNFKIAVGVSDGAGVFSIKQSNENNRKSRYTVELYGNCVNSAIGALKKGKESEIMILNLYKSINIIN